MGWDGDEERGLDDGEQMMGRMRLLLTTSARRRDWHANCQDSDPMPAIRGLLFGTASSVHMMGAADDAGSPADW